MTASPQPDSLTGDDTLDDDTLDDDTLDDDTVDQDTIGDDWIRLAPLDDIDPVSSQRFDVAGRRLSLIRFDDDLYVIGDRCSHANVSLSDGDLDPDDRTVECGRHGASFSVETGEALTLPATKPVPIYEVKVVDGDVYVQILEESP